MRRSFVGILVTAAGWFAAGCADDNTPTQTTATSDSTVSDLSVVATTTPGSPVPGLTAAEMQLFTQGMAVFATPFTPATGLGPLFNSTSCEQCHNDPVLGGYGDSAEVHVTAFNGGSHHHRRHPGGGASCDMLEGVGGPVVQQHATPLLEAMGYAIEPTPPGASGTGIRTTPVIFGLGLIDAVSDRTILSLARVWHREGVHGRPAILPDGSIGRFGRKATVSSLDVFNAGAFFNEMGVTNPLNPVEGTLADQPMPAGVDPAPDPELDAASLQATSSFVKFLAPPAPLPSTPETRFGRYLFAKIRCTSCHVPVLPTGWSPVAALRFQRIAAYTDLLLHDLGDEDADACNGVAGPREFRTQPLMGMQFLDMFMHDGVSETVNEAIARHGGEASAARSWFNRLQPQEQAALVAFVMSL